MKKALLIRLSSIGDIVLTSPVVRCLKKQLNCEVHYLTKGRYGEILACSPYIDKHWQYEEDGLSDKLRKEAFDLVLDLHKNLRTKSLIRKLKPEHWVSFDKLNVKKWIYVRTKWNLLPDKHLVDRYFEAVQPLAIKNDGKGLDYFLPEDDSLSLPPLPDDYAVIVLGAAHKTKMPELELWLSATRNSHFQFVLIGTEAEQKIAQKLAESRSNCLNLCSTTSLHGSAAVIRKARLVLTPDTGMMHVAAAFERNIISIWGNTDPAFGMYPYFPDNTHATDRKLQKIIACRPCSKIGSSHCPRKHFHCMRQQDLGLLQLWISKFMDLQSIVSRA